MKLIKFILALFLTGCVTTIKPREVTDFRATSVMITNIEENSGGTGVIFHSGSKGSLILTNRHVCKLLEQGGYVLTEEKYSVKSFKSSKIHDICLVLVESNLGVNIVLANEAPKIGSKAYISGYPSLDPHVLSEGYVSDTIKINIVMDTRECTKEEFAANPFECIFKGYPITEELEAQLVSALIAPGSSGSAVFNDKGELIGLAFASNSRTLAYALVVPWEYVNNFVEEESRLLKWQYPKKIASINQKTKKTKDYAIIPFRDLGNSSINNVENWKRFIECVTQNQCKVK